VATRTWQTVQRRYCDHVNCEVYLDAEIVLPAEHLPEQAARIIGHRCSHAAGCNLDDRPSCIWAGTNPNYDPFLEEAEEE